MYEIELTEALPTIALEDGVGGGHVLLRYRGRPVDSVWLMRAPGQDSFGPGQLTPLVARGMQNAIAHAVRDQHPTAAAAGLSLTVAICTRNRPDLLRRCLATLVGHQASASIDLLVVDNAPSDRRTRDVAAEFPGVRYVVEPVPGLDFGRNRAIAATDRDWLAFVDDDAVVDRGWLGALAEGIAESPAAGAFAGPIVPLVLETEAQVRFERAGGFGKGFAWERLGPDRWGDITHPAGGGFGSGASMVFSSAMLRDLGGFDEALDTGPPLPGGGDIDMFYRVLRAGRFVIYLPGLLVHHEHRRDLPGLTAQYYSWGLALTALHRKNASADPDMRGRNRRYLRRWLWGRAKALLRGVAGRDGPPPGLVIAELRGALVGYFGEYRRSQDRVARRRQESAG